MVKVPFRWGKVGSDGKVEINGENNATFTSESPALKVVGDISANNITTLETTSIAHTKKIEELGDTVKALSINSVPESSVASFSSIKLPLKSLKVNVNAKQPSGTPTPQSPKTITGVSAVTLYKGDKNFLGSIYTYTNWKSNLVSVGNQATSNSTRGFPLPTESGKTYTISFGLDASDIPTYLYFCKSDLSTTSSLVAYITTGSQIKNSSYTFTADSDTYYLKMSGMSTEDSYLEKINKIGYAIFELGSTATTVTPYNINLGDTYYGGDLSIVDSVTSFDANKKAVNLADLSWTYDNGIFKTSLTDGQIINLNGVIDYMCETYLVKGASSSTAYSSDNYVMWHGKSTSKNWVFVRDSRYTDAATFEANVTGKLVYVSIDSTVSPLESLSIETNNGVTSFRTNVGGISVDYYVPVEEAIENSAGNVLYGKKWAVCGDSFSNGVLDTTIGTGKYFDKKITYPWLIGNRNNMEILKFFEGGRTLGYPASPGTFTNSLTCPSNSEYYQNIPVDVDYITIYLGINDEHHSTSGEIIPIGTISDTTTDTYLGAYNVVLTWLIENRPNAHIGIIITNGIENDDNYRQGQIAIAQKYGLPYIDLNGDERTAAMLRTSNPNIASAVKQVLINKWRVSSSNTHPNDAAHIFESTIIENFLRSL